MSKIDIKKFKLKISNGKIYEVLDVLLDKLSNPKHFNDLSILKANMLDKKNRLNLGLIGEERYSIVKNRATEFVLNLLDNLSEVEKKAELVVSVELKKELLEIIQKLNGKHSLSDIISELFKVSILYNLTELQEICTRELKGWYTSELPPLDTVVQPKYRIRKILLTFRDFQYQILGEITAAQFLNEIRNLDDVFEQRYLFHEPITDLEEYAKKYQEKEELALRQEIKNNILRLSNGGEITEPIILMYSSYDILGILSDLRKYLNRLIINLLAE